MIRIREWMTSPIVSIKPRDTILHAREIMEKARINQLPVVVRSRLVGIVTDRDLRDAFPSVLNISGRRKRGRRREPKRRERRERSKRSAGCGLDNPASRQH